MQNNAFNIDEGKAEFADIINEENMAEWLKSVHKEEDTIELR